MTCVLELEMEHFLLYNRNIDGPSVYPVVGTRASTPSS